MKCLLALMLAAMLNGTAGAAQYNNSYPSDDAQQGADASTFVLLGSGLIGVAIWFKKATKQKR